MTVHLVESPWGGDSLSQHPASAGPSTENSWVEFRVCFKADEPKVVLTLFPGLTMSIPGVLLSNIPQTLPQWKLTQLCGHWKVARFPNTQKATVRKMFFLLILSETGCLLADGRRGKVTQAIEQFSCLWLWAQFPCCVWRVPWVLLEDLWRFPRQAVNSMFPSTPGLLCLPFGPLLSLPAKPQMEPGVLHSLLLQNLSHGERTGEVAISSTSH